MLLQISIKNFAIFKDVVLEPGKGFNAITGESGAGKSVIVNALSLICGARAYKEMIRTGERSAIVEAVFRIPAHKKKIISEKLNIDEDLLVITRELHKDKPSLCKINGKIRNLSLITEISSYFIDIHGQYENQTLMDVDNHIKYLDDFAHTELKMNLASYQKILKEYNSLIDSIVSVSGGEAERERNRQILEFQIEEISSASLERIDETALLERKNLMENAEKYKMSTGTALNYIEKEEISLSDQIRSAVKELEMLPHNETISSIISNLNDSFFTIQDTASELARFGESIEYDENEFEELQDKLEVIKNLKRKYGNTIEEILIFNDNAKKQLLNIQNFKRNYARNLEKIAELEKKLYSEDAKLSQIRTNASEKLKEMLLVELYDMGMKDSVINISITKESNKNKLGYMQFQNTGRDRCEFLISLNKGLEPVTLGRIASGGEMSRIMLSFKTVFSYKDDTETVVFDEIDSGISGDAAIAVADKLDKLSLDKQIICITHLPQIAARADGHFVIQKTSDKDSTRAAVRKITEKDEKIHIIASLTDGENVSEEGMLHAVKILDKYNKYFN